MLFAGFVAVTALLFCQVSAFWRLLCDGSTGLARLDPLMSFGQVGPHVHSIKGGSAFRSTATAADLIKSNCTSCGVQQDKSAYWSPALYFLNSDDNTFEVVPEKSPHKTYYFLNSGSTHNGKQQTIEAFSFGFQMIAGNNYNRNLSLPDPDPNPLGPWPNSPQDEREQRALGFNYLNYAKNEDEPSLFRHKMPSKEYLDANCRKCMLIEPRIK